MEAHWLGGWLEGKRTWLEPGSWGAFVGGDYVKKRNETVKCFNRPRKLVLTEGKGVERGEGEGGTQLFFVTTVGKVFNNSHNNNDQQKSYGNQGIPKPKECGVESSWGRRGCLLWVEKK